MNVNFINNIRVDEYVIRDGKKHEFAIVCPGGGYEYISDSNEGKPVATKLNEIGVSAFVVYYSCGKLARFPKPLMDLGTVIQYIVENKDNLMLLDNYSIWGFSAGGHLVSSFGTDSLGYKNYNLPKPQALILSYPVISMGMFGHEGSRNYFLGISPDEELIKKTSVELLISKDYPATFIWCGLDDKTVSPMNSFMLKESLDKYNVLSKLVQYENVGHGVGLGEGLLCEDWFEKSIRFWKESQVIFKQNSSES